MAKINIGGRLHSTATGNVVTGADEVLYEPTDGTPKKQSEVNVETYEHVANIDVALQELSPDQTEALALATDVNDLKDNVVRSDAQTLTDVQKAQALSNLGISGIDDEPTAGSENLVKSGGIQNELVLGAVYNVSAKNPTSGPNNDGKFASLSALLSDANLSTLIPTTVRKGGMSIKFVQSSDNKYIQARCMAQNFTTDVTQWQGVDTTPKKDSANLETSGGVFGALNVISTIANVDAQLSSGSMSITAIGATLKAGKTYEIGITSNDTTAVSSGASILLYKTSAVSSEKDEIRISTFNGGEGWKVGARNTVLYTPSGDRTNLRLSNFGSSNNNNVTIDFVSIEEKYATKDELGNAIEAEQQRIDSVVGAIESDVDDNTQYIDKLDEALDIYPSITKNTDIDEWSQGYRHERSGATIQTDAKYITTTNSISAKAGDILYMENRTGIANVFLVNTDGTVITTNAQTPYIFVSDVEFYVDLRNVNGITPSFDAGMYLSHKNDMLENIAKEQTKDSDKIKETSDKVEEGFCLVEEEWTTDNGAVSEDKKRIYTTGETGAGTATTTSTNCHIIEEFIPVGVGDEFIGLYCMGIFKYSQPIDATSAFIGNTTLKNSQSETRKVRFVITQEDWDNGVRYIRAQFLGSIGYMALTRVMKGDYKILNLGDSIFGKIVKPYDQGSWIQRICGFKDANCGFGGTKAARHGGDADYNFDPNNGGDIYNRLSLYNIADCIASGDFTSIDIDWGNSGDNDYDFLPSVQYLKTIDYSKLKVITLAYGTNDWNSDKMLDDENDKYNKNTYLGAIRYSIETIVEAYPNIQIILLSPVWRCGKELSEGEYVITWTSDNKQNLRGKYLYDFVEGLKSVADEYHLPFFDNYKNWGINSMNEAYYIGDNPVDGTHYKMKVGGEFYGRKVAQEVKLVMG